MAILNSGRRSFNWDDSRAWVDGGRWELIGGEAFRRSPAPTSCLQAIVSTLSPSRKDLTP